MKRRIAFCAIVALAIGGSELATATPRDAIKPTATLTATVAADQKAPPKSSAKPRTIGWEDLLPAGMHANSNPVPPPSTDDYLSGGTNLAARQVLDFSVENALDGQLVRLPGFIVPLELASDGQVTEFFFVPYFGACIHVPPPPPNQIVYVHLPTALALASIYDPYWITGKLSTHTKQSRMGAAAYSMEGATLETYTY